MAATVIRNPPVEGFNYDNNPTKDEHIFEGFGVTNKSVQRDIKAALKDAYRKANPDMKKFQTAKERAEKKRVEQVFYNEFPQLGEAPEEWKAWAITHWMTAARTSITRTNHKRSRQESSADDDDDDDEDKEAIQRKIARRQRQRITPVFSRSPTYGTSLPAPSYVHTIVHFCGASPTDILAEIEASELLVESTLSWNKLGAEAEAYRTETFDYKGTLYLSPRENQHLPIKTQATLNSALNGLRRDSTAVFTTKPLAPEPALKTEDARSKSGMLEGGLKREGSVELGDRDTAKVHADVDKEESALPSEQSKPVNEDTSMTDESDLKEESALPSEQSKPVNEDTSMTDESDLKEESASLSEQSNPSNKAPTPLPEPPNPSQAMPPSAIRKEAPTPLPEPPNPSQAVPPSTICKEAPTPLPEPSNSRKEVPSPSHKQGNHHSPGQINPNAVPATNTGEGNNTNADQRSPAFPEATREDKNSQDKVPEEEEVVVDDDEGEVDDDQAAIDAAVQFASTRAELQSASMVAERRHIDDWTCGAKTYLLPLEKLRLEGEQQFVTLPKEVGLSPSFTPMPHQIVGSTENHKLAFGKTCGSILGDKMGLAKTGTVIMTHHINYRAVLRTWAGLPSDHPAHAFPTLEAGMVNGVPPKIGATFISASPQGVEAWARDWKRIMSGSCALKNVPEEWKPKLVILHGEGDALSRRYGGPANGIYTSMSRDEWAEVFPKPDWKNKSHLAPGSPTPPNDTRLTFSSPDSWPIFPGATLELPAPTSTRYIIVSTYGSWRTKISCVVPSNIEREAAYKELVKAHDAIPKHHNVKKRQAAEKIRAYRADSVKRAQKKEDGFGPTQATRTAMHKGINYTFAIQMNFAAWLVIDELHAAGAPDTINYLQIVDPIRKSCGPKHPPGITAMSGNILAGGISVVITFADRALRHDYGPMSPNKGVRVVASLSASETMSTWAKIEQRFKTAASEAKRGSRKAAAKAYQKAQDAINKDGNMTHLFNTLSIIIQFFFIARSYETADPWGRVLRLVNGTLDVQYLQVAFDPTYHALLEAQESQVQAASMQRWQELQLEWEMRGSHGPSPAKPALSKADANAYHAARIMATFPNIFNAIDKWHAANPTKPRIVGETCPWKSSLGGDNEVLSEALASPGSIRYSFLWDIAKDACQGSAKMTHVLQQMETLNSQRLTVPHPDTERAWKGETIQYRSKYVVTTGIRVVRALVWCMAVQEYGEGAVVMAANSSDRIKEIPKWRRYYDLTDEKLDDDVFILVAGLGVICQSINLVEGCLLEGLEPHANNYTVEQATCRQFRVGQHQRHIRVRWLVHKDSVIDNKIASANETKDRLAHNIKQTTVGKIGKIPDIIDITNEDDEVA